MWTKFIIDNNAIFTPLLFVYADIVKQLWFFCCFTINLFLTLKFGFKTLACVLSLLDLRHLLFPQMPYCIFWHSINRSY